MEVSFVKMPWSALSCVFLISWSMCNGKTIQSETDYKHDTIPDNKHRDTIEEKELWLEDFTDDKVNKKL